MLKRIIPVLTLFLFACSSAEDTGEIENEEEAVDTTATIDLEKDTVSFQGAIHYDITYEFHDSSIVEDQKSWILGRKGPKSSARYGENGGIRNDYAPFSIGGVEYDGYVPEGNVLYYKFNNQDSIQVLHAVSTFRQLEDMVETDERLIAGYPCKSLSVITKDTLTGETNISKYYYTEYLYLDPEPYAERKTWFLNEVYARIHSPILGAEIDHGGYRSVHIAHTVEKLDVTVEEVTMPTDLPIVEL